MDYYPQPRPVMYGTTNDETPAQTQTAPVRIGPPRYPPAPPLGGDAPFPFGRPPAFISIMHEPGAVPMAILYAFASAYSVLQAIVGGPNLSHAFPGQIILLGEMALAL